MLASQIPHATRSSRRRSLAKASNCSNTIEQHDRAVSYTASHTSASATGTVRILRKATQRGQRLEKPSNVRKRGHKGLALQSKPPVFRSFRCALSLSCSPLPSWPPVRFSPLVHPHLPLLAIALHCRVLSRLLARQSTASPRLWRVVTSCPAFAPLAVSAYTWDSCGTRYDRLKTDSLTFTAYPGFTAGSRGTIKTKARCPLHIFP